MNWINSVQPSFGVAFGITTPIYTSTNGTITNTRITDVTTPRPKTEVSPIEDAIMYLVGNVSNTGTYVETIESLNVTRGNGHGIITYSESNNKVAWNAYDMGKRINNSTYVFKGIIFFDVLPSHDRSNELMFLDDGVGVYKSKVSDTGNTREIWTGN